MIDGSGGRFVSGEWRASVFSQLYHKTGYHIECTLVLCFLTLQLTRPNFTDPFNLLTVSFITPRRSRGQQQMHVFCRGERNSWILPTTLSPNLISNMGICRNVTNSSLFHTGEPCAVDEMDTTILPNSFTKQTPSV